MKSLNETTQLIRDEHKKLRGLLRQLEGLDSRDPGLYRSVMDELCVELQVYFELEEGVLFPRLRANPEPASERYLSEQCLSDHREITRLGREVCGKLGEGARPEELPEKLDDLRSAVEAYMYGEERQLLPVMERCFPMLDAELSMKWLDASDEIRARPHVRRA